MDLSRLSDDDLRALSANNLGAMSDEGLKLIASGGQAPAGKKGIGAALAKGFESTVGAGQTTLESLFGANEAAKRGLERERALGEKYQEQIGLDKLKEAYEQRGLTGAGGELLRQVPLAFAEQGTNIASALGGARLGAMAGSAFGPVGTAVGAGLGALTPAALQLFGSNVQRQAAEQEQAGKPVDIDVGKAAAATAVQAPLDVASTFIPLGGKIAGKFFGPQVEKLLARGGTEAAEKLAKESLLKTGFKGLATGAAAEIPTEILQQVAERAQAGLDLLSPEALKEYGETAYQVGLLAPMGGVGRFVDKAAARTQVEEKKKEEQKKIAVEAQKAKEQEDLAKQQEELQKAQVETGQLFGEAVPEASALPGAPSTLTVREREAQAEQAKTEQASERSRLLNEADKFDKQLLDIEKQRDAAAEKGDFKAFAALDSQARALEQSQKEVNTQLKSLPLELSPDMEFAKLRGEQKNLIKQLQGMTGPSYDAEKAAKVTAKLEDIDKRITELTPAASQMELFDEAQIKAEENQAREQQKEQRAQEEADLVAQIGSAEKISKRDKQLADAKAALQKAYDENKSDEEIYRLIEKIKGIERREVVSKDVIDRYQKGLLDLEEAYAAGADERVVSRLIDDLQRVGEEKDLAVANANKPKGPEQEQAIVKLQRIRRAIDEEAAKFANVRTDEEVNAIRANIGALQKRYAAAQAERANVQPENVEIEANQEQRDALLTAVENVRAILSGEYINSFNVDVASSLKSTIEDRIRDAGAQYTTAAIKEINAVRAINKQQPLSTDEALKVASAIKSRFDYLAKDPTYLAEKVRDKNLPILKKALEKIKVDQFKGPSRLQKERPLLRQQFGKPEKEEAPKGVSKVEKIDGKYVVTEQAPLTPREKEAGKKPDVSNVGNLEQLDLFGGKELEPIATVRATPANFRRFVGIQANRFNQAKEAAARAIAQAKERADKAKARAEAKAAETAQELTKQIAEQKAFIQDILRADQVVSDLRGQATRLWQERGRLNKELKTATKENKKIIQNAIKEIDENVDKRNAEIDALHARANEIQNANLEYEQKLLAKFEKAYAATPEAKAKQAVAAARAAIGKNEAAVREQQERQLKEKRLAEQQALEFKESVPFIRREVVTSRAKAKGTGEGLMRKKTTGAIFPGTTTKEEAEKLPKWKTSEITYPVTPKTPEQKREETRARAAAGAAERKADKEAIKARLGTSQIVESKELTAVLDRQAGRAAEKIAAKPGRTERKKPLKTGVRKVDVTKQGMKAVQDVEQEARDIGISREDFEFVERGLMFGFKARTEAPVATKGNVTQADVKKELAKVKMPKGLKIVVMDKLTGILAEKIQIAGHMANEVRGGVLPDGTVIIVAENHKDINDVKQTIAHELIGHIGVESLLGEAGMRALAKQIQRTENSVFELAKKLGVFDDVLATYANARRTKSEEDSVLDAVRELIAHTEEATPTKSFLEKARDFIKAMVGAVRAGLRKMGLDLEISSSDIYKLLRDARKQFNEGSPGAYVNKDGDIMFRSEPAVANAGFENVLADSDNVVASQKSLKDRILGEATGLIFKTKYIDRFAPVEAITRGMEDSLKATQLMYFLRMHDQRMAWTSQVASHGPMQLKSAADGKGLIIETEDGANLKDMAAALRDADVGNTEATKRVFTMYLAAKRAKRVGLNALNFGGKVTQKMLDDTMKAVDANPATRQAFEKAADIYAKYNEGLINFAVKTGALSKEVGAGLLKHGDYVPFYRPRPDGSVWLDVGGAPPIKIGNLADQPYLHELVGGDQPILDVFTSALQNTAMLTDMALRNLATRNVAFTLNELGLLEGEKNKGIHKGGKDVKGPKIIRFKRDGEDYWAEVNTDAAGVTAEILVKGLEGVNTSLPNAVKMMNAPANLLRKWVTRNPAYALRQIVRDPLNAVMTTGLDTVPIASSLKEIAKMVQGKSEGEPLLQRRGILGGQVLTGTEEDKKKIMNDILSGKKGWDYRMAQLDQLAIQGDASTRVVMYNNFIKQGLSEMEATLATLEAMNFSKRGISPSLFALSTMVPFMNAQIQGLNVLYQAFTGKMPFNDRLKVKQKLVQRALMMAAFTMVYASMMADDEGYQNANDDEKYGNWFVPNPFSDEHIRVPIPFEVGLLFKALPEALVNTAWGDTKARDSLSALGKMAWNSVPIGAPQGLKPLFEVAINHSFYTGRAIDSERMMNLEPGERYDQRTTEVSKTLGSILGVSPNKIDYLIRGYTGSLPLAITSLANPILRGGEVGEQPESRGLLSSETPLIGSFFQPTDASGLVNKAYKDMEEVVRAKATYDKMIEEGRIQEANAYVDANADMIAMASFAGKFRKQMGEYTKKERQIRADVKMTGTEKREALDEIRQLKIELAKDLISARE